LPFGPQEASLPIADPLQLSARCPDGQEAELFLASFSSPLSSPKVILPISSGVKFKLAIMGHTPPFLPPESPGRHSAGATKRHSAARAAIANMYFEFISLSLASILLFLFANPLQ
jgi:hypothetical protein